MKILIILPYFGERPEWLDYFIKSCSYNTNINWLFYGNFDNKCIIPENIKIKNKQIEDFNKLATAKLNFPVNINNPYKICDFRPAFGVIFSEYIDEYDFWGYCDLDLIFGTISNFLQLADLRKYDIITTGQDNMAGHFTIYRNSNRIKQFYKTIWHIERKLKDSARHYYLDEKSNYIGERLTKTGKREFRWYPDIIRRATNSLRFRFLKVLPLMHDISRILINEERLGNIRICRINNVKSDDYYIDQNINNWLIEWENGSLKDLGDNTELMYFHFIKSKNLNKFRISEFKDQSIFRISQYGIKS